MRLPAHLIRPGGSDWTLCPGDTYFHRPCLLSSLFEGEEVDEATSTCMAEGMEGKVKEIVIEGNSDEPTTIMALVDECLSPEMYAQFLVPVVEAMGVQEATDCVAEQLGAAVPFSQFMAESENDEPSAEFQAAFTAAATACGVDI